MFVQRIPYQSVRRRRIRHWLLLADARGGDRAASSPRSRGRSSARARSRRPPPAARARSSSCSINRRAWATAITGRRRRTPRSRPSARWAATIAATLVLFSRNAEENMRATTDHGRARGGDRRGARSDPTRRATAPRSSSPRASWRARRAKRREAVLISDFQRAGWSGSEDAHFPEGHDADAGVGRLGRRRPTSSVPSVTFARSSFSGQERVTVTAGIANRSGAAMTNVAGRRCRSTDTTSRRCRSRSARTRRRPWRSRRSRSPSPTCAARSGPAPIRCPPTTPSISCWRRAPRSRCSIVDSGDGRQLEPYLSKALSIGTAPAFQVDVVAASRLTPSMFDKRAVVILNDTPFPPAARRRRAEALRRARRRPARRRRRAHRRGRTGEADLLPGTARRRRSTARTAAAARSASSITAIRSSRSSRRRAAATSPPRTSSATARS